VTLSIRVLTTEDRQLAGEERDLEVNPVTEQQILPGAVGQWLRRGMRYGLMAALGAVVATSVATLSAHGGDAAKVHGCYLTVPNPGNNPPLGTVRIVGANETCKQNETARDWNAQGVPGPQGPQGATGAAGAQGPAGPSGLAGLVLVRSSVPIAPNSSGPSDQHACPPGKRLVSGSATIGDSPTNPNITATNADVVFVHGWILHETTYGFVYKNATGAMHYVHVQLLCG
jgi:hypothetical protein